MLKNLSSIALAGAMIFSATGCIFTTGDDSLTTDTLTTDTQTSDTMNETSGDGDGDMTGDGDGDMTGDGDGDPATGDGDGDMTGDGDGDMTGDGDGDMTGGMCGWDEANMYYDCGFEGSAPDNTPPIECPDGLVEGDPCDVTGLTGAGCCDAEGNIWYCTEDTQTIFTATCE